MSLRARLTRIEKARPAQTAMAETIDRPPQESREDWIARMAGNPPPGLMNSRGETRAQWIARRTKELSHELTSQ